MSYTEEQAGLDMQKYYGYTPNKVYAVQGGTVAYTFSVDDKYFLKIYDDGLAITPRCVEHLQEQLLVLDILQNCTPLRDKICCPVKTVSGALFFAYGAYTGVLFNFIPGAAVGFERTYAPDEVRQLTDIVKALHSVDESLFEELCPKECYDLRWCEELKKIVQIQRDEMPARFREAAEAYECTVRCKIEEAYALAEALGRMRLPFVLCHTDIHPGNVMCDPEGKLWLVDWENVILAPKEADLFSFAEKEGLEHLAAGANETAMLYYTVRRDLEDIYEFLRSVLNGEFDAAEEDEVYGHVTRILAHLKKTK